MKSKKRIPSWLVAAIFAFVLFAGSISSNLLASGMEDFVNKNRLLMVMLTVLAGFIAVASAILETKSKATIEQPNFHSIEEYNKQKNKYLTLVSEQLQFLPLRGVDLRTSDIDIHKNERLKLSDIYVSLDTTTRLVDENSPTKGKRYLAATEAVIQSKHLIILGDPGGGKTTFVNHLAFCLAQETLNPKGNWIEQLKGWDTSSSHLIPIPITLRDIANWLHETQPSERKVALFEKYLEFWLQSMALNQFHNMICSHLRNGDALLLLDGLDELGESDTVLSQVKDMINSLHHAYSSLRIVVTCRVLSYQDKRWSLGKDWVIYELNKLDEPKIIRFVSAWYNQLAELHIVKNPEILGTRLIQAIQRPDLWRLASNPLLLTVMALVHTHKGELPSARAALYEDVVDLLLWRWEATKIDELDDQSSTWGQLLQSAQISNMDIKRTLWELAYNVHSQSQSHKKHDLTADIEEIQLLNALKMLHPKHSLDWANSLIQIIKLRAGLLIESRPSIYNFPHRTFQEYLAACYLSNLPDFTDRALELSTKGIFWREVTLLAVGRLVHVNGDIDRPLILLTELFEDHPPTENDIVGWRKIWVAGECILEIGTSRIMHRKLGDNLISKTRNLLNLLISTSNLEPRELSEAGSVLGAIGDPRNLDEMILIPAGSFIMGITEQEAESFSIGLAQEFAKDDVDPSLAKDLVKTESPQHKLHIDDFYISKYPVTNSQYARFVTETNHTPPSHWHGLEPPLRILNHPVVFVSWYDAVSYCEWLSQKNGVVFKLPSEAEWEKTSRGVDTRTYPWGDEFLPEYCNMKDTGIGDTSSVGIIRHDKSPYGVLDMAGNVWEWTRSLWDSEINKELFCYPYNPEDGRESEKPTKNANIVLRGGSFAFNRFSARCTYRDKRMPYDLRHGYIGFRVVTYHITDMMDISLYENKT